jgi:hypothetical protein
MMPSDPASVRPCRIALIDCELAALIAGNVAAGLRAVQHLGVLLRGGDGHFCSSVLRGFLAQPIEAPATSVRPPPGKSVGSALPQ